MDAVKRAISRLLIGFSSAMASVGLLVGLGQNLRALEMARKQEQAWERTPGALPPEHLQVAPAAPDAWGGVGPVDAAHNSDIVFDLEPGDVSADRGTGDAVPGEPPAGTPPAGDTRGGG